MFWKLRDYVLPGKRNIEDEPATAQETRHVSTLLVECLVNGRMVYHKWHSEYDPEKDDYLKDYEDFLDWYTKPAQQRVLFYTIEYNEGQRVLKREHIVGVSVTKDQRKITGTPNRKII